MPSALLSYWLRLFIQNDEAKLVRSSHGLRCATLRPPQASHKRPIAMTQTPPPLKFRRDASIGTADAETDGEYLANCFVDTGDFQALKECSSPKRIVVGRTGSGKSALIRMLRDREEHVIPIAPEVLSLDYITNSTVLRFFEDLGVKLDLFYTLLWRHVFTVELIKYKFRIQNEKTQNAFIAWLQDALTRDKAKKKALEYLESWGSRFWEETEYRIKEFTTKLEQDLSAAVGPSFGGVNFSGKASSHMSEEQRKDVIQRAQHVVSAVQIKDLAEVMRLLEEDVFDDPIERYYIVIDRLDENWVDDRIRNKLLRALLEAVRAFQQVRCVKIVVALRVDLLDRVFRETRDAGFQEEKYESLFLKLRWSQPQLEQVLDKRVELLIRKQYTKEGARMREILPVGRKKEEALNYILDRTFLRPREAIIFVNECLTMAEGKAQVTWQAIQSAEVEYSRKRLRSLADEWHADYPLLVGIARLLHKRRTPFYFRSLTKTDADELAYHLMDGGPDLKDLTSRAVDQYISGEVGEQAFLAAAVRVLYQVGILGFKPDEITATQWSYLNQPTLAASQLGPDTHLYVHPTFWRTLGTVRE
jgi:hypothetical protein